MLTQELNEKLTQLGPGTPMGELLRRYWQVVGTTAELAKDPMGVVRDPAKNDPYIKIQRETVSHQAFRLGNPNSFEGAYTARINSQTASYPSGRGLG